MNSRSNPLFWSFSIGTWFQTRIRVHWFLPVAVAWLLFNFGWALGGAVAGVLIVTVLLHEFSHIAMARTLGIDGDEILLWPLGGLAFTGGGSPRQQFLISAAGPFCNLLICLAVLYPVLTSDYALRCFNPLMLPVTAEEFVRQPWLGLALLTFTISWVLLLMNLVPAMPLDGGQMARSALVLRLGNMIGTEASIRLAMIAGMLVALAAMLLLGNTFLVGLGFFLLLYAVLEHQQSQMPEQVDDSFMGYDFSQGYTSLEKSQESEPAPQAQPGFFERWKKRREEARARREAERDQQAAEQLDILLAKVHEHGLQSLSESEKRTLKQASDRLRDNRKVSE
jgi:Zn-dependent protease